MKKLKRALPSSSHGFAASIYKKREEFRGKVKVS